MRNLKKNNSNAEYMNLIGHELRSPLVPLLGYLGMILEEKKLDRNVRKKLNICLKCTNRELALIQDIIDNSKLEAGILKFDIEEININKFLNDIVNKIKTKTNKEKLYIKTNIQPELPPIKGDSVRLKQAINNILNNAIRMTNKGGITITARIVSKNIEICIIDTGIGFNKKDFKSIFSKFAKFNLANENKEPGTGLEMIVCKQIIEGHKGKLWFKSTPKKGTSAYFTIPN